MEDADVRPCRVLVSVEPPLLTELLVRLLGEPGRVEVTADASSPDRFDIVMYDDEPPARLAADGAIGVELRSNGRGAPDLAIVSAAGGDQEVTVSRVDEEVSVSTVEELAALIRRLCRP